MKTPKWSVKAVKAFPNYTLLLTFADNSIKIYNAKPLLEKPLYAPLRNLSIFKSAKPLYGTVVWTEDIDIAPEHLYQAGEPIV